MKGKTLLGSFYLALAALIFSTMEVVLKLPAVSGSFHPMQITVERFFVGGLFLLPLALRTLKKRGITLTRQDFNTFVLTGFLCVPLAMVCYQLSITHGQANVVAVLFSSNPIFVTLLAYLLLREKIYWYHILALVLEAVGILVIIDPFGGSVNPTSALLVLLAALFFALYSVLGKRKAMKTGSIVVTCFSFFCGGGELLLLILLGRTTVGASLFGAVGLDIFCDVPFLQGMSLETLPYFLFLAVVNTAGGYVFHMLAVETTSATYGSLAFFFKPILAPLIALAVLHEAITLPMAVGILFFLAGSLASIVPEARRAKSIPPAHNT